MVPGSSHRHALNGSHANLIQVVIDSGNTFTPLCVKVDAERDQVTSAASSVKSSMWIGAIVITALAYVI